MQKASRESDPVLWDLSTNKNITEDEAATEIGSDKNIEENDALKEKKNNQVFYQYVVDIYISANEVMNIAHREGKLPV